MPVVASILDVGASGGYYVALAADRIFAHPTTVTGSIGVLMLTVNASGLLEKIGVSASYVKSGDIQGHGEPIPAHPAGGAGALPGSDRPVLRAVRRAGRPLAEARRGPRAGASPTAASTPPARRCRSGSSTRSATSRTRSPRREERRGAHRGQGGDLPSPSPVPGDDLLRDGRPAGPPLASRTSRAWSSRVPASSTSGGREPARGGMTGGRAPAAPDLLPPLPPRPASRSSPPPTTAATSSGSSSRRFVARPSRTGNGSSSATRARTIPATSWRSSDDPRIRFINLERGYGEQSGPNNEAFRLRRAPAHRLPSPRRPVATGPPRGHPRRPPGHGRRFRLPAGGDRSTPARLRDSSGRAPRNATCPTSTSLLRPGSCAGRLIEEFGPWRSARDCYEAPSEDLLFRVWRAGKDMRLVPRLTVLVIPAGLRPGVYARRDTWEQEGYVARMQDEVDFRERELSNLACGYAASQFDLRTRSRYDRQATPSAEALTALGLRPMAVRRFLQYGRKGAMFNDLRRRRGLPPIEWKEGHNMIEGATKDRQSITSDWAPVAQAHRGCPRPGGQERPEEQRGAHGDLPR